MKSFMQSTEAHSEEVAYKIKFALHFMVHNLMHLLTSVAYFFIHKCIILL